MGEPDGQGILTRDFVAGFLNKFAARVQIESREMCAPFLFAEEGADALQGNAIRIVSLCFEIRISARLFSGGWTWTGFDYKGEPTPYGWPNVNSHFGILDICGPTSLLREMEVVSSAS